MLYRRKSGVLDPLGILELTCALYIEGTFSGSHRTKKHVSILRAPVCHGYFQTFSSQDTDTFERGALGFVAVMSGLRRFGCIARYLLLFVLWLMQLNYLLFYFSCSFM